MGRCCGQKPVTRESAALAGECLRTLVLMQTLPKDVEIQQGLMNLLLEAVVMILSGTENSLAEVFPLIWCRITGLLLKFISRISFNL